LNNIYSTNKIIFHPEILTNLKKGIQTNPIQLHLMPDNRCNHSCNFCSYKLFKNKNNERFDCKSYIPKEKILELIDDFSDMGGKAIEITGGGCPLIYPYKTELINKIIEKGLDYALVTNGTLLTEDFAKIIAPKISWVRISIDAGKESTYTTIRCSKKDDFKKALNSIVLFRKYAQHKEFKLGVGFVITNDNYLEVYDACKLFKDLGADNVRISAIFHPDGIKYFSKKVLKIGTDLSKKAETLNNSTFKVYNLFSERILNLETAVQDYKFCGTKELLCVVGGNCEVYLCCSLAFNKKGLIGSIKNQSFKELWSSKEKTDMFNNFNVQKRCTYACLYEQRNKYINDLIENNQPHVNFI
jgi:MoaA/NifB/PqqE/SkfB family radical SAM enzyme